MIVIIPHIILENNNNAHNKYNAQWYAQMRARKLFLFFHSLSIVICYVFFLVQMYLALGKKHLLNALILNVYSNLGQLDLQLVAVLTRTEIMGS